MRIERWVIAAVLLACSCGDSDAGEPRETEENPASARDAATEPVPGDAGARDARPRDGGARDAGRTRTPEDSAAPPVADASKPQPDAPSSNAAEPVDASRPEPEPPPDLDEDAGAEPIPEPENDSALFPPSTLLEVDLKLSVADWNLIRGEGRSLNEVFSYCIDPNFNYTTVPASARVAGIEIAQLGLRKKGFIGSLSSVRPSLRLEVDEYLEDQTLFGQKTLVLNNSLQDASYTHTCMSYAVFEQAGVAAPRCSFALVRVNGEDLGIYLHVEAIKKPFLARRFGDDEGHLYEGGGMTDFRPDLLVNFEKKTNESDPLAPEIVELSDLLAQPDDAALLARLETLLDFEQFLRFWASEVLVAHWDGYTGDLNNFYLYVHPTTRKLQFIPSGTDAAFEHTHAYLRKQPRPESVYAWSRLPHRLYAIEQTRERFRATLRSLLETAWDENALLADVDRIASVLGDRAVPAELEAQRTFIRNRRSELLGELDGPAPAWSIGERPSLTCQPERNSAVTGSFEVTWGDLSAYGLATANVLDVVLDGTRRNFSGVFGSAGLDGAGQPILQVGAPLPDGRLVAARFMLREIPSGPGEVALHGFETYGAVVRGTSENIYALDGFISSGKLIFERVGAASGAILSGRFEGQLVTLEPALAANYGRP